MNPDPQIPPAAPEPEAELEAEPASPSPAHGEPWKTVYFGQVSQDLVPYHPEPPEAPEDELERAAMEDPQDVTRLGLERDSGPTLWRLLTVILVAVGALAIVFWRR